MASSLHDDNKDESLHKIDEVNILVHDIHDSVLSEAEKAKALRKVDMHLLPPLALLYLFSYVDRSSLANASIFGYKTDVGITTTQYNLIATMFFFTYSLFEVPANVLLSYVRPNLWIAGLTFAWGVVTCLSGLVHNFGGAMAARLMLGVTESGMFPAAVFLASLWYPRDRLAVRISVFYAIGTLSGAFSGLIAYAVSHMQNVGGLHSWRWLFILEGLATVLLSFVIFAFLPNNPEQVKWLSPEEKEYLVAIRTYNGDSASGDSHFEMKYLKQAACDWKVFANAWLGMCSSVPAFGFAYTLPTIIVQLGFSSTNAQLMTIPVYAIACVITIIMAWVADRIKMRGPVVAVGHALAFIGLLALYCLPKKGAVGARYFFAILVPSGCYVAFSSVLTWGANNAAGKGKRGIAVAIQLTLANLASAIGTNTYLAAEAPRYETGFGVGFAFALSGLVVNFLLTWRLRVENAAKEKVDVSQYSAQELEDMGDKAPTFKYML